MFCMDTERYGIIVTGGLCFGALGWRRGNWLKVLDLLLLFFLGCYCWNYQYCRQKSCKTSKVNQQLQYRKWT